MADTVDAVTVLEVLGTVTKEKSSALAEALENQVTMVHSDNPSTRALLKELGYQLFRCRDMNTGGDI